MAIVYNQRFPQRKKRKKERKKVKRKGVEYEMILTNSVSKLSVVIMACLTTKSMIASNCVYMLSSNIFCAWTYSSPVYTNREEH